MLSGQTWSILEHAFANGSGEKELMSLPHMPV